MSTRQRLLLGLALLTIVSLAVLGRDFVGTYIAPTLLYIVWSFYYRASGIPQFILWGIFLGLLLVLGLRSLTLRDIQLPSRSRTPKPRSAGRVRELRNQLATSGDSAYFKHRVIRHLATLTLSALGHRERLTPDEARAMIRSGQVPINDELLAFLEEGWQRQGRQIELMKKNRTWLDELLSRLRPERSARNWSDPRIEALIAVLESELEVEPRDN